MACIIIYISGHGYGHARRMTQVMRELSTQPGFTDTLIQQIGKGGKKGPALLTPALAAFYERYRGDALVVDKWFMVQALSSRAEHPSAMVREHVQWALAQHVSAFSPEATSAHPD